MSAKFNYVIGDRWNQLRLMERLEGRLARFLCTCGQEKISRLSDVRLGRCKSCGCHKQTPEFKAARSKRAVLSSTLRLGRSEAGFNRLLRHYTVHAVNRGFSFNLTPDQFKAMTQLNCFYCGHKPSQKIGGTEYATYIYNGVDRLDNAIGYTTRNCVAACKQCNWVKGTRSHQAFIQHCSAVLRHNTVPLADYFHSISA